MGVALCASKPQFWVHVWSRLSFVYIIYIEAVPGITSITLDIFTSCTSMPLTSHSHIHLFHKCPYQVATLTSSYAFIEDWWWSFCLDTYHKSQMCSSKVSLFVLSWLSSKPQLPRRISEFKTVNTFWTTRTSWKRQNNQYEPTSSTKCKHMTVLIISNVLAPSVLTSNVLAQSVLTSNVLAPSVLTSNILAQSVLTSNILAQSVLTSNVLLIQFWHPTSLLNQFWHPTSLLHQFWHPTSLLNQYLHPRNPCGITRSRRPPLTIFHGARQTQHKKNVKILDDFLCGQLCKTMVPETCTRPATVLERLENNRTSSVDDAGIALYHGASLCAPTTALGTRVRSQVWARVKYVPRQTIP